ncbi:uncharacterized protein LOC104851079 [Fukomys damarensis]|uniref:uncharacterized protein LOC104851079 n=1 Tax=Fukomys damarensis TaxID=885580 RepID=UPI00053FDFA3|nr:uncharacterized protein LOC104851079 [Fukomys damarensis]
MNTVLGTELGHSGEETPAPRVRVTLALKVPQPERAGHLTPGPGPGPENPPTTLQHLPQPPWSLHNPGSPSRRAHQGEHRPLAVKVQKGDLGRGNGLRRLDRTCYQPCPPDPCPPLFLMSPLPAPVLLSLVFACCLPKPDVTLHCPKSCSSLSDLEGRRLGQQEQFPDSFSFLYYPQWIYCREMMYETKEVIWLKSVPHSLPQTSPQRLSNPGVCRTQRPSLGVDNPKRWENVAGKGNPWTFRESKASKGAWTQVRPGIRMVGSSPHGAAVGNWGSPLLTRKSGQHAGAATVALGLNSNSLRAPSM